MSFINQKFIIFLIILFINYIFFLYYSFIITIFIQRFLPTRNQTSVFKGNISCDKLQRISLRSALSSPRNEKTFREFGKQARYRDAIKERSAIYIPEQLDDLMHSVKIRRGIAIPMKNSF